MSRARPHRKKITRYYTPDGKRVPARTPGSTPRSERSATWYGWIDGEWRSLKTTDEAEAWKELRRLQRRAADEAAGIADDLQDHARVPLLQHVEVWLADVTAAGASKGHVYALRLNVGTVLREAAWKRLGDITSSSCLQALARVVAERDLGPQSRNHYLSNVKQFARWAAGRGQRLSRDPLAGLPKVSVEEDQRRARRRPTEEELARLFDWLALPEADLTRFQHTFHSGAKRWYKCRMTGRQRALGYRVCMGAGLRAGELRSLARGSFDLDAGTVTLRAAYDKRGKSVVQPLPSWLVEELRAHFDAGGECWSAFPRQRPGRVLQYDLGRAGVAYSVPGPDGPLFFDFHALRHAYISALCDDPNTPIKVIQTLARHSTPSLTLNTYAKARREDVTAAANRLPPPPGGK